MYSKSHMECIGIGVQDIKLVSLDSRHLFLERKKKEIFFQIINRRSCFFNELIKLNTVNFLMIKCSHL